MCLIGMLKKMLKDQMCGYGLSFHTATDLCALIHLCMPILLKQHHMYCSKPNLSL